MLDNANAEKYNFQKAVDLFEEALQLTEDPEFDTISILAKEQKVFKEIYRHLVARFPELKTAYSMILNNMEANCYSLLKRNEINTAGAVINLKANFKWNDRPQEEAPQEETKPTTINISVVKNGD